MNIENYRPYTMTELAARLEENNEPIRIVNSETDCVDRITGLEMREKNEPRVTINWGHAITTDWLLAHYSYYISGKPCGVDRRKIEEYRPFNMNEISCLLKEHGGLIVANHREQGRRISLTGIYWNMRGELVIRIDNDNSITPADLAEYYVFNDDTPCGVRIDGNL